MNTPIGDILINHKKYGIPSFESITRARRNIQKEFPELESAKTKAERREMEEQYYNYYNPHNNG